MTLPRRHGWLKAVCKKLKEQKLFYAWAWLTGLCIVLCLGTIGLILGGCSLSIPLSIPGAILLLTFVLVTLLVSIQCFLEGVARPYYRISHGEMTPDLSRRSNYTEELLILIEQENGTKERNKNYLLLQKQAQINALQQQINPHFLYNALDSVRGLAYSEGAAKTADMVETLAIFFRYTIGGKDDLVRLSDELHGIRNYLKIQQYRYMNPLQIRYQIDLTDEQTLQTMLPRLTLQPIVENSIKHGKLYLKEDAEILI